MEVIDSHHHLWDTRLMPYAEFADVPPLNRPFTLPDLLPELSANGVSSTVCVEAASAGADGRREATWLRDQFSDAPVVAGVVAWAPVEDPNLEQYLSELISIFGPLLVGIRRSFECDPADFPREDSVVAGVQTVGRFGYPFDLVLNPPSLPAAAELVNRSPDVQFVLDHMGKPEIRAGEMHPWRGDIEVISRSPNVVCKISGLSTQADHKSWTLDDLRPYLDHAVDCFGWERLLFGSDWPVTTISGGYKRWLKAMHEYLAEVSPDDQAKFFGMNCRRVYRLSSRRCV